MIRLLKKLRAALPTLVRLLLGFMLVSSGWRWLHRPDVAAYLTDAINVVLDKHGGVGFYRPFLTEVVLPHAGTFGALVGWGEFLSGVSLFLGVASRLPAGGVS